MRPFFESSVDPNGTMLAMLRDRYSPCTLSCGFCVNTLLPRPEHVRDPALIRRILAEFRELVATNDVRRVVLASADILDYPGLFGLLDVCREAGREIVLVSPGLALADMAFVDRLVPYRPVFDLTYLSARDDTYDSMVGVKGVRQLVHQAIDNLRARQLPLKISTVVSAANAAELDRTLAFIATQLGQTRVTVRLFYPDLRSAPPDYYDRFPALAGPSRSVSRIADSIVAGRRERS